jgi:hypothetical protein
MIGNIFCRIGPPAVQPPAPDILPAVPLPVELPTPDLPVPLAVQPPAPDLVVPAVQPVPPAPNLSVADHTKKRTRTALTIAVKIDILQRIDKGERIVKIARHYGWYNYYMVVYKSKGRNSILSVMRPKIFQCNVGSKRS